MTHHGIDSEHLPAVDAAAWCLLALLLFCVLCFAFGAWVLWRRERRRTRDPGEAEEKSHRFFPDPTREASRPENRAPWERDENWWQNPPPD